MHIKSAPVGSNHDRPPERRPRLAIGYVLFDADDPNPFRAVVAAGRGASPREARSRSSQRRRRSKRRDRRQNGRNGRETKATLPHRELHEAGGAAWRLYASFILLHIPLEI